MTDHESRDHSSHDQELLAAYALRAVPFEDAARVARQLRQCSNCAEDVRQLQATSDRLAGRYSVTPPAAVKDRTMSAVAALAGAAQAAPTSPVSAATPERSRRRWMVPVLAGLAASLLLATVGLGAANLSQQRRLDAVAAQASQEAQVLRAPNLRTVAARVAGGGEARAFVAEDRAVVLTSGLPELPADRTYQLWVGDSGSVRSAGVLGNDPSARALVEGVEGSEALLLSVEPAGGSEQPTTTPVWQVEV